MITLTSFYAVMKTSSVNNWLSSKGYKTIESEEEFISKEFVSVFFSINVSNSLIDFRNFDSELITYL